MSDLSPQSDILTDAQTWLDALPERIGTHWPDCHTDRHHAPCLVRKLMDEIARLRLTDAEREAVVGVIDVLEQEDQWHAIGERRIATLRGLLERTDCS